MRRVSAVALMSLIAAVASAQNQVATVTSSAPFSLRGAAVTPGQGVPTWPILPGDELKAGNALTIVAFLDGSVLTLSPGSDAKIDFANGRPVFQLLCGKADHVLKSASAVELMAGSQVITPKAISGVLTVTHCSGVPGAAVAAGGGFWTAGHTAAVVLVVGAAIGLPIGIYETTSGGQPVSQP
jgi:hypothetical protein